MAYTSIATAGGWSTNTVTQAYDLFFRWQLKAMPLCRQFVDVRPQNVTHRGDSVKLQLNSYFSSTDVVNATTPLSEEADVTPTKLPATTSVVLTPQEYGLTNLRTLKLANRTMVPIDPVIAKAVGAHAGDTIDYLLQTQMRGGTNVIRSANRASTATITQADVGTANMIRTAVTNLRANSVQPRDGEFYVGIVHPDVVHDIRTETGAGNWRDPNTYGTSQRQIWAGEFGAFEGARFIQSPSLLRTTDNDGATSEIVHRWFLMGQEALAEAVVTEAHTVLAPVVDSLRRNQGIGWYADLAFARYREAALYRLESASSLT